MPPSPHPLIVIETDPDGSPVVGVALAPFTDAPPQRAWLDFTTYDTITSTFGVPTWFLIGAAKGKPFVRVRLPGQAAKPEMGARLVWRMFHGKEAGLRRISYRDGDRLNLRHRNLVISSGRGDSVVARLNAPHATRRQATRSFGRGG